MPVVGFINAASAQNYTRQLACSIGSLVAIGLPESTDNFDSLVTLVLKGHTLDHPDRAYPNRACPDSILLERIPRGETIQGEWGIWSPRGRQRDGLSPFWAINTENSQNRPADLKPLPMDRSKRFIRLRARLSSVFTGVAKRPHPK